MSLTVAQLMKLPCLRRAKVLAGHQSLRQDRDQHLRTGVCLTYGNTEDTV